MIPIKKNQPKYENIPKKIKRFFKSINVLKILLLIIGAALSISFYFFDLFTNSDILEDFDIPSGPIQANLNFSDPQRIMIEFPYDVSNDGLLDLNDIKFYVYLYVNYSNKNSGEDLELLLLNEDFYIGQVRNSNQISGSFNAHYSDFSWQNIDKFILDVDQSKEYFFFINIHIFFKILSIQENWIIYENILLN